MLRLSRLIRFVGRKRLSLIIHLEKNVLVASKILDIDCNLEFGK